MSDEKPKPVDDLKEGLGLLFRAAKGAVEKLPTEKVEVVAKDAVKEVSRAFESIGSEIDKALGRSGSQPPAHHTPPQPPPQGHAPPPQATTTAKKEDEKEEPPKEPPQYDDGYAPEPPPPKGPRIG